MDQTPNSVHQYKPRSIALYVNPAIHRKLKRYVAIHDLESIQAVTEVAVQEWLDKQELSNQQEKQA